MKKEKEKKKNSKFKKLFILLLICIIFYYVKSNPYFNNSGYKTIAESSNKNYSGIGQETVKDKDGYFTTFTTVESYKKTYKEYKQNGKSSWSNNSYWGGTMEQNGCGITAISIILSGYNKAYTPENLREKYYPVLSNEQISTELSSFGIENTDFYYDSSHLSSKSILEHLQTNRPILICVWNQPKANRWTEKSHYMVLLANDGNNMVYVSNPNGLENNSKSSGWYKIDEITPYIAKALYVESY